MIFLFYTGTSAWKHRNIVQLCTSAKVTFFSALIRGPVLVLVTVVFFFPSWFIKNTKEKYETQAANLMLTTKFPTLISFFELPSCFVICWGWLKTEGLFAMCDMRRLFASEIKLQIAWKIVRKNEIKKTLLTFHFWRKIENLDTYC